MTPPACNAVVVYLCQPDFVLTQEGATLIAIANTLARVKKCRFAGRWDDSDRHSGGVFFVPDETLIASEASRLGIWSACDLFGGVVPYAFVRTKAVTHGLVSDDAER